MALSEADKKYLNADQQKQISALKDAWAAASAAGDQAGMDNANKQAEAIRAQAGYSGGSDGSGYALLQNQSNAAADNQQSGGTNSGALLSGGDQKLSADLQAQIAALKQAYAQAQAAGDTAGMQNAHNQAEAIRNQAGYTAGADGSGYGFGLGALGGNTADKVAQWVRDYESANLGKNGWSNGYSTGMNLRSMANYIRQQMDANSKAYDTADDQTKAYLHQQNLELAQILSEATGGAESIFNEKTGQWETYNANLGYGKNIGQYNDLDWYRNFYGMTDDQIEKYQNDTDRYRNFVDQRIVRNWVDERNGFTGEYAQFVNGPYAQLLNGTNGVPRSTYVDVQGDGFGNDDYAPKVDMNGNIIAELPALKNNNYIEDYTRNLAAYTQNGVIMPNVLNGAKDAGNTADNLYRNMQGTGPSYEQSARELYDQNWKENAERDKYDMTLPQNRYGFSASSGSTGGSDLSGYLNQMYDAQLKSQLAALESAYQENLAELERNQAETDAAYNEQKRQTQGDSERAAANWRELAVAQGLNTGAMGQAALSQNNQLQSNLNTLGAAQAQALANIQSQRTLLGKQYQLQILQAQADNDFERAQQLYAEAVRQDEILREQEQQAMSMMQSLLSKVDGINFGGTLGYSGGPGNGGGGGDGDEPELDETEVNNAARFVSNLISMNGYGTRDGNYLAKALMQNGYSASVAEEVLNKLGIQ